MFTKLFTITFSEREMNILWELLQKSSIPGQLVEEIVEIKKKIKESLLKKEENKTV